MCLTHATHTTDAQVPGLIAVMQMMSIVPWHGETRDGDLLTFTHTGSLDPAM